MRSSRDWRMAARRGPALGVLPVAALLVAAPGAAQDTAGVRLDAPRLNAVFAEYAGHTSPGCALGVYRSGAVAFARGYGMADLERQVPITPSTLFDIGSTSKQFTAAAIALLVADGRLAWEDDVRKWIPELPEYGSPITIDHLVRHTSGLRDYIGLLYMGGRKFEDASDDAEALAAIVRQRALNFAPGSAWDYSNSGFFLLSVVARRITGRSLAQVARERIFEPLGMEHSHVRDDHTLVVPGRAMGYSPKAGGGFELDMSNWDQTGDGAVWTSVIELARWDANFTTGAVGGRTLRDHLQKPGRLANGEPHRYGRGVFLDRYRGLERVHHGGSWAGFRAMLMRFPTEGASIAVLCNVGSANPQTHAERVADVVLDGRFTDPAAAAAASADDRREPAPVADSAGYVGFYYSDDEQSVVHVVTRRGVLHGGPTGLSVPLARTEGDRFDAVGFPVSVTFHRRPGAPADSLIVSLLGKQTTYARVVPAVLAPADLSAYTGRYYSPELDATYEVSADSSGLQVSSRTQNARLTPAMRDGFSGPIFVRFTRDRRGRVAGFELSMSRVKRLVFERR